MVIHLNVEKWACVNVDLVRTCNFVYLGKSRKIFMSVNLSFILTLCVQIYKNVHNYESMCNFVFMCK